MSERVDTVLVEEPLEIRADGLDPITTMRTPGNDLDLAIGLLLAEGLISQPGDVATAVHCTDTDADGSPTFNVLNVTLAADRRPAPRRTAPARTLPSTSACGVCGSATIDDVRARLRDTVVDHDGSLDAAAVPTMITKLREAQRLFGVTGGSHAAALFRVDGSHTNLLVAREDVGRHNAVDKVIGWAAREFGWPLRSETGALVLAVSSRASFEILQKAWSAGIGIVVVVSAASSLAIELADAAGITLVGMVRETPRGTRMNVYSHPARVRTIRPLAALGEPPGVT